MRHRSLLVYLKHIHNISYINRSLHHYRNIYSKITKQEKNIFCSSLHASLTFQSFLNKDDNIISSEAQNNHGLTKLNAYFKKTQYKKGRALKKKIECQTITITYEKKNNFLRDGPTDKVSCILDTLLK